MPSTLRVVVAMWPEAGDASDVRWPPAASLAGILMYEGAIVDALLDRQASQADALDVSSNVAPIELHLSVFVASCSGTCPGYSVCIIRSWSHAIGQVRGPWIGERDVREI